MNPGSTELFLKYDTLTLQLIKIEKRSSQTLYDKIDESWPCCLDFWGLLATKILGKSDRLRLLWHLKRLSRYRQLNQFFSLENLTKCEINKGLSDGPLINSHLATHCFRPIWPRHHKQLSTWHVVNSHGLNELYIRQFSKLPTMWF